MKLAVSDCIVGGYEELVAGLTLPDPADRHVLAAAIRAGAQIIVTFNLAPGAVVNVVVEQSQAMKNPPRSVAKLLDTLRDCGLVQSVAKLRELFGT